MKSKFIILTFFLSLFIISCDKTIVDPAKPAYTATNLDPNAGNWKTYILQSNEEISVPEPNASSSAEYKAELESLKTFQTNIDKATVDYWSAGAVYRWHEIARELAAKYNLAPAFNAAKGIYPVPDAANPQADPKFPFANPPYTARMLAYLGVAQYDALVATWHYKFKYNRPAVDIGKNIIPTTTLPSYPSEDAVVAAASHYILTRMFPGEITFLDQKLKECKEVRLYAGKNVLSDIAAGENLGKAVATKVMARAATDGAGAANNQALVPVQRENAKAQGIIEQWISLEIPARPPMLPNFGAIKAWNFDKAQMTEMRPKLPYAVGSDPWKKELAELQAIDKNQTREQARIANFWADGAGSYTPPGHWNRTAADACFEAQHSPIRMARTLALVNTSLMDAAIACWETKYFYYTPRPQQFNVKTSVGLPNFPAYTSGHSTFSAAAATVLGSIFPENATKYTALAKEASESRIYGLIHFRIDCEMGLEHGRKIGELAIKRGKNDGSGL